MSTPADTIAPNLAPADELEAINRVLGACRRELARLANHTAGVILADIAHPFHAVQDNADRLAVLSERIGLWEVLLDRAVYGTRDGEWSGVTAEGVEAAWVYAVNFALHYVIRPPQEHGLEAMVRQTRARVATAWLQGNRGRIAALPAAAHARIWHNL